MLNVGDVFRFTSESLRLREVFVVTEKVDYLIKAMLLGNDGQYYDFMLEILFCTCGDETTKIIDKYPTIPDEEIHLLGTMIKTSEGFMWEDNTLPPEVNLWF